MMSSEISIEETGRSQPDDGFRPWHFFVLVSILLATVAVIMARQSAPEHLILISFTIAAAGAAAGAFYRMLAPLTAPVVLRIGEPVSERTRAALEREKVLVLRSIKDLEFDRAMGKLSQKDFDEMAGRLRARAMSLMRQLDLGAAGYSDSIEQELKGRLQTEGRLKPAATTGSGTEGRLPSTSLGGKPVPTTGCRSCRATNDPDAVFCKKCGTRLQA